MTVFCLARKAVFAFFEIKNAMRRVVIGLIAAWCCAGCTGLKEIPAHDREEVEDVWPGPEANGNGNASETVCYITGIDYPPGWDWTDDVKERESARCSLMVFADGVPMLRLPVGEGHEVSADPDMHEIIDGHLYTVFCSNGYTSIRKDGKAFLRYEGEETMRAMVVDEENIHTLNVPRDGKGFTYRKNGELVMDRRTGYAFERLHIDSGKMCFAFCQPVTTSEGQSERYYIVRDGRLSLVEINDDIASVWDMMSHQGKTCMLVSSGPWRTTELIIDEEKITVRLPYGAEMLSCRLFSSGQKVCIEGMYADENGNIYSGIWIEGQEYMLFETGQSIAGICSSDKDICCVLNPDAENPSGIIFSNGKTWDMPDGYHFRGNNPIVVADGDLHIGLTSINEEKPLVWKNGKTTILKLNGPICNLSLGQKP